jgi:hypothetical protein
MAFDSLEDHSVTRTSGELVACWKAQHVRRTDGPSQAIGHELQVRVRKVAPAKPGMQDRSHLARPLDFRPAQHRTFAVTETHERKTSAGAQGKFRPLHDSSEGHPIEKQSGR